MAYETPSLDSQGPVGDGDYVVYEGDCIESIALDLGYLWTTIWHHPRNGSLTKARVSQNLLLPGDAVYIPEKRLKTVNRPTDQKHRFVRMGTSCELHLCVKQVGEPRRNEPYVLVVDGTVYTGSTDAEGWIQVVIPASASSGKLTVGESPQHQQTYTLELGGMDPVTEPIGVQKRLHNLGFSCPPSGEIDDATSTAISLFQKSEGLESTGELDQLTIQHLKERYGA